MIAAPTTQERAINHQPSTINSIHIVSETADWIVVDKPPFIEAHPSKPNGKVTLWDELRGLLAYEIANGGQVSLINRLDRETSGLTLVAKHHDAARVLHMEMQERNVRKEYLAIVWGWPDREEFEVDAPILRQGTRLPSPIHLKQAIHPDGAAARTRFRVEQRYRGATTAGDCFALVRAFPETGRMHQIRVHLAHTGHPVVGDKIYGPDEQCYLEFIQTGWTESLARRLLLPRHALHSTALHLPGRGLSWQSPLAGDLSAWVRENLLATPAPRSP